MPTAIDTAPPLAPALTPARGTEWISVAFGVMRAQFERRCAFEPCGEATQFVLVFPADYRGIRRHIAVCPRCAADCFGIEVISAALNVH